MNKLLLAASLLMIAAAPSAAAAKDKAAKSAAAKTDLVWPIESMPWKDGPMPGIKLAALWGDMGKGGAYAVLVKFDAGLMHDNHSHSSDLKIVVVSGVYVHKGVDGKEHSLKSGSYLIQRGGVLHASGCAAGAECVFFMSSNGKFDMTAAKP